MKQIICYFLFLLITPSYIYAQAITGQQLLKKSIKYHDPKDKWDTFKGTLPMKETRPNGADRQSILKLDNKKASFYLGQNRAGYRIEKMVKQDICSYKVNGSATIVDSLVQKFRLTCPQLHSIRNYYVYLWGMPMKLKDQGTQIDKKVSKTTFQGNEVLSMKVTYEKSVGEDIWYFYFNPTNYALVGYRFYHDEAANDGEYIPLVGEEIINGIRFPKTRTWYINKDDRLLGADILEGNK